jgi:CHAT domain-containing protein/tetratricopeptide (TPR) repeat protein
MIKKKILFSVIGIFFQHIIVGQCPDYILIKKKLFELPFYNDSLNKKQLFNWRNDWQKCHYKEDSLFAILNYRLFILNTNDNKSIIDGKKCLELFKKSNSRVFWTFKTNYFIAVRYFNLNQFQEAKKFYNEAIKLSSEKIQSPFAIDCYLSMGYIYLSEGDYQSSNTYLNLGVEYAKKIKDFVSLSKLLAEKANVLRRLGDSKESLKIASSSLNYALKLSNQEEIARRYELIGRIYTDQNQIPSAIKSYQKSLQFLGSKNPIFRTTTLTNVGFLYLDKIKNYDEALKYFQEALSLSKNKYDRMAMLDNTAYTYAQKKQFALATKTYQKAFKEISNSFNENTNDNPKKELLQQASKKSPVLTLIKDKADTWLDYHKFQPNKSHLQNALNTYKTADRMIDIMRWEQTGEQSKLFWRKKTRSIYQNAIETCYLLNKPEEAFYFFEKSRAVMLNDRLKELGAKQLLSPEDQSQESKLQQEVDNARKLVSENKTNNEENQQKLLNSENAQTAFFKQIELKNPTYYRYKYDTSAVNIKDLQRKLKDQTLVEYFVADSVVYAFVVSANGKKIHQIKASNYGNLSNEILSMMADENALNKQFTRYLGLSNQFYKQFVEPLSLPKGRVIVSPDGTIVPFSALSFSASQAQYLVKDYAFGYTYSAKFLNQEKKSIAPNAFLGIAPVQFKNNQLKLKDSDLSLQRIAERFSSPQLLLKEKASRKTFLETMGKYQVVQLYTHALANDTTAQLYLADSIIKASELTTKDLLPTELVVLSACQTGIGKDAKGEGIFSLSRSFAMLGIPSTLTTLWKVDNQATYQITELFYQYLDEGLPKDLALQKAQNEYLSQNTAGLNMPNFWAGYVLVGDNSPLEKSNQLTYWILGGILLGGIGFYFKQKSPQKRAF